MIIVTHEMQFARELSERIIFMEQGVICQEGTPEEVFNSPNARVREFIGRVMNVCFVGLCFFIRLTAIFFGIM